MNIEQALAFLVFAILAAITPGPSNLMLTAAGAQGGILRGLPCLLGVSAGMGFMMFLVPLGLGSLVLGHPPGTPGPALGRRHVLALAVVEDCHGRSQ